MRPKLTIKLEELLSTNKIFLLEIKPGSIANISEKITEGANEPAERLRQFESLEFEFSRNDNRRKHSSKSVKTTINLNSESKKSSKINLHKYKSILSANKKTDQHAWKKPWSAKNKGVFGREYFPKGINETKLKNTLK